MGERLTAEGVPHTTTVGTLEDVGAILAAARMAGIPDFEEHLWLGSLLETFYLMRHERRTTGAASLAQTPQGIEEASGTSPSLRHFIGTGYKDLHLLANIT